MMELCPMEARHLQSLAALERECFSAPWSEESLREELYNPLSLFLVAEEQGEVVGYIGSQTVLGESDMMNLAVRADARRRGVGRALVCALCAALRENGAVCLTLEVRASNAAAIALYTGLGFSGIGRRPGYYAHPREDAELYRKDLRE